MTILGPSLTGLRGTQITGSISYTLVTWSWVNASMNVEVMLDMLDTHPKYC
jgi:hypothetical protein